MHTDDRDSFAFADAGLSDAETRDEIEALVAADHSYEDGTVFNSLCSEPIAISSRMFAEHQSRNVGDNRIFPSLRTVERRVTSMLGQLLGHPGAHGGIVSGGTEANFLAIVAALRAFRECHPGVHPHILTPQNVHFSVEKAAMMLGAKLVRTRIDARFRADIEDLARHVTPQTAVIVVTAGTSETGAIDNVPAAARIASAAGVPLHVDAATGGLLIPFAKRLGYAAPDFDFSVPGVTSITVDPHKYGGTPIPSGCLLFRDAAPLRRLSLASHYRGTNDHWTLLGTRSGAAIVAAYAAFRRLGRDGYTEMIGRIFEHRDYLVQRLVASDFDLAFTPELTVVGVAVDGAAATRYLEARGYVTSSSRRHSFLRLVVHRHLATAHLDALVAQLETMRRNRACA